MGVLPLFLETTKLLSFLNDPTFFWSCFCVLGGTHGPNYPVKNYEFLNLSKAFTDVFFCPNFSKRKNPGKKINQDQIHPACPGLPPGKEGSVLAVAMLNISRQLQTCYGIQSSSTYILILIFTSRWFLFLFCATDAVDTSWYKSLLHLNSLEKMWHLTRTRTCQRSIKIVKKCDSSFYLKIRGASKSSISLFLMLVQSLRVAGGRPSHSKGWLNTPLEHTPGAIPSVHKRKHVFSGVCFQRCVETPIQSGPLPVITPPKKGWKKPSYPFVLGAHFVAGNRIYLILLCLLWRFHRLFILFFLYVFSLLLARKKGSFLPRSGEKRFPRFLVSWILGPPPNLQKKLQKRSKRCVNQWISNSWMGEIEIPEIRPAKKKKKSADWLSSLGMESTWRIPTWKFHRKTNMTNWKIHEFSIGNTWKYINSFMVDVLLSSEFSGVYRSHWHIPVRCHLLLVGIHPSKCFPRNFSNENIRMSMCVSKILSKKGPPLLRFGQFCCGILCFWRSSHFWDTHVTLVSIF